MNDYLQFKSELYHHGIKGQKWGVRRYQNYDGSYTKSGMKRYNKSLENYQKADERYKSAKNAYKQGGSKTELDNARLNRKTAKNKLNKDYKHLKQDKLADQGKELYSKGHTIYGDAKVTKMLAGMGSIAISTMMYNQQNGVYKNDKVDKFLAVAGVSLIAGAGAKAGVDAYRAKRIRAYYSHTSSY